MSTNPYSRDFCWDEGSWLGQQAALGQQLLDFESQFTSLVQKNEDLTRVNKQFAETIQDLASQIHTLEDRYWALYDFDSTLLNCALSSIENLETVIDAFDSR